MQTFRKSERLCTFRLKELLFNQGEGFFVYPFRIFFLFLDDYNLEPHFFKDNGVIFEGQAQPLPEHIARQNPTWPFRQLPSSALFTHPAKAMVSVSKKNYKKATERNLLKRRIKEAYRKNKQGFYTFLEDEKLLCLLAFVYTSREILPYSEIENKIILTLQKLQAEAEANKAASAPRE
ncbi:MAG: ribonuclease P protein component [Bacteroides sp.]|jgi:ribonuclease P protein component|nr:ribonuclease P protein component [Bacteroides sp.]